VRAHGAAVVALSGGSTPRALHALLADPAEPFRARVPFPGTDAVRETTRLVAAPWVATLGTHRITLTPPVLNGADRVAFLVTGSDKAETLAAVLEGPRQPDVYPSQAIAPRAGALVWLVDRAAAARLAVPVER
jgi:6-phosphogluconolactonase